MTVNLKRVPGWRTKMQENLDAVRTSPFQWGIHDCGIFAWKHVKAITGTEVLPDFSGQYFTAFGAMKALKEHGYDSLLDFCQKNFQEVHMSQTRTGDLVIIQADDTGYGIGVILSNEAIGVLSLNGYGIIRKNNSKIVSGFKIDTQE